MVHRIILVILLLLFVRMAFVTSLVVRIIPGKRRGGKKGSDYKMFVKIKFLPVCCLLSYRSTSLQNIFSTAELPLVGN